MSQPPVYTRQNNLTAYQANNPGEPMSGSMLDNEYNAIKTTLDTVLANLALIQRDDGELLNNSVGLDQFKVGLSVGLAIAAEWATGTAYDQRDTVWDNDILYFCLVQHTSTVFTDNFNTGYWLKIIDFSAYAQIGIDAEAAKVAAIDAQGKAELAQSIAEASVTGLSWGNIAGTLADQTDLQAAIDNAGQAPAWRGATRYDVSLVSIPSGNGYTTLPLDGAVRDTEGFWNASNRSRFTIPAGVSKVRMKGSILFHTDEAGAYYFSIDQNGGQTYDLQDIVHYYHSGAGGTKYINMAISTPIIDVNTGWYYELGAKHFGTSNKNVSAAKFEIEVIE